MLFGYRIVRLLGVSENDINIYGQTGIVCEQDFDVEFLASSLKPEYLYKLWVRFEGSPDTCAPLSSYLTP